MRTLSLLIITCLLGFFNANYAQSTDPFIRPAPKPARVVNDYASLLSEEERQNLSNELFSYWKSSTNCIVVITVPSLTDSRTKKKYTIEELSLKYFNTWGIGDKVKNNGVLLFIVPAERAVRIEVGRGLEQILTNDFCSQVITNQIVPHFKQQEYYAGLKAAIKAIQLELSGESDASVNGVPVNDASTGSPAVEPEPGAHPDLYGTQTVSEGLNFPATPFIIVGFFFVAVVIYNLYKRYNGDDLDEYSGNGYRRHNRNWGTQSHFHSRSTS